MFGELFGSLLKLSRVQLTCRRGMRAASRNLWRESCARQRQGRAPLAETTSVPVPKQYWQTAVSVAIFSSFFEESASEVSSRLTIRMALLFALSEGIKACCYREITKYRSLFLLLTTRSIALAIIASELTIAMRSTGVAVKCLALSTFFQ